MTIKRHELLGVPKHANQHRLSRLTMEVHTYELRIMASAVESYTDELIAALEAAEKRIAYLSESNRILCSDAMIKQDRIAELEALKVKLPERYDIEMWPEPAPTGEWYSCDDVLAALTAAGIKGE
ncbi:hypothetical protein QI814_003633 [Escherichia coli]|nr:hypothetical protein [Escherichia coli]